MKLTKAEKEFVLRERRRIELDSRDWNSEPFVTDKQLAEMSAWRRNMFSENIWRRDHPACVLRNTTHPDNKDWANRELLLEALR